MVLYFTIKYGKWWSGFSLLVPTKARPLECDLGPAIIKIAARNAVVAGRQRNGNGAGWAPHAGRAAQ